MKDDYDDQPEPKRALPTRDGTPAGGFDRHDDHGGDQPVEHSDWYAPEDDSRLRTLLFKYLPILFLCLIAFWPAWRSGQFLWRDDVHVTANPPLRSPLGLWTLWKSPTVTPDWAPLSYSLLWPQYFVWTGKVPMGYHLVGLFLHTFNAIMVWMLLRRLDVPGALFAAIVFALHPLQIEPVAWIARQPMIFASFWGLLFSLLYLRFSQVDNTVTDPSKIFRFPESPGLIYTFALVTYLLAVLSYPLLVCTLPLAMALVVWWKKDDFSIADLRPLLPMVLLGFAAVAMNWWIEGRRPGFERSFTALETLLVPARAVWFYIGKLLLPIHLAATYQTWTASARDVLQWLALVSILVIGAALWLRRREVGRAPVAALAVYIVLLLPMITPVNRAEMELSYVANRFHYLATIVPAAVVIGLIASAMSRLPLQTRQWAGPVAGITFSLVLMVIVHVGYATSFSTPLTLWENTKANDPSNFTARIRLGKAYQDQANEDKTNQDKKLIAQAVAEYEFVDRASGGKNLDAKLALGEIAEAEDLKLATWHYRQALAIAPDKPDAYRKLGDALAKQKQFDEADKIYQDGLRRFPRDADLHRLTGISLAYQKKRDEALPWLKKAVDLDPFNVMAHVDYGNILTADKKFQEANDQFIAALTIDPRSFDACMGYGTMWLQVGNLDRAYNYLFGGTVLKNKDANAAYMVGVVTYFQAQNAWINDLGIAGGKIKESTLNLQRALELNGNFVDARKVLDAAKKLSDGIAKGPPPRPATRATQPATRP